MVIHPMFRQLCRSHSIRGKSQRRSFAVKELTWCSPKKSTSELRSCDKSSYEKNAPTNIRSNPSTQFRFGIIAAMDESRVIGIDSGLPWTIPDDRNYFIRVTQGRTLVIGKNCFFESSDGSHLRHLRHVVVVSTSMKPSDIHCRLNVHLVRSFEEALECSQKLERLDAVSRNDDDDEEEEVTTDIQTWIGGGQRIYEEAIQHEHALEIRLTTVHSKTPKERWTEGCQQVAFFPAKTNWDNIFQEERSLRKSGKDDFSGLTYTMAIYRRIMS